MTKKTNLGFRVYRPHGHTARHHVRFKDHVGVWRRVVAYSDAVASAALGRQLRTLSDQRAAGLPMSQESVSFVQGADPDVRQALERWGVIDRGMIEAGRTLAESVADWGEALAMDNSADYVLLVTGRVSRVIEGIGCQRFIDLHPAPIREYLAALGVEPKTKNHYIVALVGFVNWMIQARRAAVSPLRGLLRFKVREAARRRRALTEEEFARLLKAAAATDGRTMTGVARAALYCLAASTGYRAGELRSMVAANFTLDADPPRVSCRAGCTKSNREDSLPITPALADMLRPHVAAATTGPVFKMPRETWKLMRNDLRAAGIPQIDGLGRIYDFHSLRVQLAVDMHRGGLHDIKARQLRMRHANSAMTLDTYTRLGIGEGESEALAALPDRAAG